MPSSSILVALIALIIEWVALGWSLTEVGESSGPFKSHSLCYGFQSLLGPDCIYGAFLDLCIGCSMGASYNFLQYVNGESFQEELYGFWASLDITCQSGQVLEP